MRKILIFCITVLIILSGVLFTGCQRTSPPPPTTPKPVITPAKLVFTTQPSGAKVGSVLTTQPVVTIQDANGNTATGSGLPVTLSVTPGTGTSGAILYGPTTINAVNGVARFNNVSIDKAGTGFTITAKSSNLPLATSAPFDVAAGEAAKAVFTRQPAGAIGGAPFTVQPEVTVTDIYGNRVPGYQGTVNISITFGSGPNRGVLSGKNTINAVDGVARFTDLSINQSWPAYTLTASANSLASETSIAFGITAGAAVKLEVTVPPSGARPGEPFGDQPRVAIEDVQGNVVTSSTAPITVTITPGTGTAGAKLSGQVTVVTERGVAWYEDLAIDLLGTGYTITATSSGLTPATSSPFDVAAE